MNRLFLIAILLLFAGCFTGCSRGPEPIRYGEELGAYCRMPIADARFAAELVTTKGKVYKFDSIECLDSFLREGTVAEDAIDGLYVSDLQAPGTFLRAESARFIQSEALHSPMGQGLAAVSAEAEIAPVLATYGGAVMGWEDVRARLADQPVHSTRHGH